ncbi:MAG: hypothetical protein AVDCRST_MAG35-2455 [uncultured Quadrisphaera sp.]|uniref:Uncharacterized protein n=1 Tax=uncultured Quadrisphaera sp. TaxID=904978 RepID=A0A6J4Q299_9ACTN|nr:MAG: hypothetical protein AVDCRST_MAG35-2455 [uncultured Quadrisphaera sp.]
MGEDRAAGDEREPPEPITVSISPDPTLVRRMTASQPPPGGTAVTGG